MSMFIAVGPREQDFAYTGNFFNGTVTLYGSGVGSNSSYCSSRKRRINHNVFNEDQVRFIDDELMNKVHENPDVRFMSYDPNQAFNCSKEIVERTVCLNEKALMDKMNDKIAFRNWAKSMCNVQISKLLFGSQCSYENLCNLFVGYDTFVIQAVQASGGEGTFILTFQNCLTVAHKLSQSERYMVSGYEKSNIPLNIHAIIYKDDILIFPISIQIMRLNSYKLLYQGADYIAAQNIDAGLLQTFKDYMLKMCRQLQCEGYRGITGVDAMIVGNEVRILEMNNRFQGSTILLNMALNNVNLPSMPELNYEAFTCDKPSCVVDDLIVPYSCFTYIADKDGHRPRAHYREFELRADVVDVLDEGLNYDYEIAPYATLERVIFNSNIVSVSSDNKVMVHPNITDISDDWVEKIVDEKNILYTKIALINQGVHISTQAQKFFCDRGGMREAVYNAIDIQLGEIVINAPINVKFSDLSPFELKAENDSLKLYFINEFIADVDVKPEDEVRKKKTSSGQAVRDICLLATDRVRVQHSCNCDFVRHSVGCKFCEVEDHEFSFDFNDICESIDLYKSSDYKFRHFLIGGRSDSCDKESKSIVDIANYINRDCKYPIYVMCVPPFSTNVLDAYYKAGVTEIAFNIEIWDRELAKKWMPGKGAIPLSRYLEMLKYAVTLWGSTGAVRSSFVVGLEPMSSLLEGIEKICSIGAAPILSVFRPIPGTIAENVVPLTNSELLALFYKATAICDMYGLELGPQCIPCQNNTLSLPRSLMRGEG